MAEECVYPVRLDIVGRGAVLIFPQRPRNLNLSELYVRKTNFLGRDLENSGFCPNRMKKKMFLHPEMQPHII